MPVAERPFLASQENLLTLLGHSDQYGKLVASVVEPSLFEGDYRVFAERFIDYWREHGEAPKLLAADLFSDILEGSDAGKAKHFRRLLIGMATLDHGGFNVDYVLAQLANFRRMQLFRAAFMQVFQLGQGPATAENLAQIEQVLQETLRAPNTTFDPGLWLGDTDHLLAYLAAREQNEFITGIPELDRHHAVPTRGQLTVLLGPTSLGKSWWLVHVGRCALLLRHKKVAHVTLELSAEEVQKRYFQSCMGIPAFDSHLETMRSGLLRKQDGSLELVKEKLVAPFSMQQTAAFAKALKQHVSDLPDLWRNLVIKSYPTRGLSVGQLRGYLNALEATGFVPDLLIVDYAGIMRTESDRPAEYRIALGRTLEELRGLAMERNIALATAQQVSKLGMKAPQVDMSHVAEDVSIVFTADQVLSFSSSEEERKHKLARLWVNKNRSAVQDFGVVLTQLYERGQFVISSSRSERENYEAWLEELSDGAAAAPELEGIPGVNGA
jgi:hypothetical protein